MTEKINKILMSALNDIDKHVRAKTDQLKSDRNELNRQLYEILYAEAFIKKQSEQADPLEFLNLNTGYTQVKYSLVNQWPIVSGDLGDMQDLLKIAGEIKVIKPGSSTKLQSQGGALSVTQKHVPLTSDAGYI